MTSREQEIPALNEADETTPDAMELKEVWIYTPDFLDLPGWRTIAVRKTEHNYDIVAELQTIPECSCGRPPEDLKPAGTLVQRTWDIPRDNRRSQIHFLRKRFKCSCSKYLLQPLVGAAKRRSVTERAARYIALEALGRSFDEVAAKVGVSSKTVKELLADYVCTLESTRRIMAPEILGIDGVCVGRRKYKRSYCLLTDISNSQVLELLGKSTELELARFLKQLPRKKNIRAVVIDMSIGFLVVIRKCLPDAEIVIDPFHVLRKLNDSVNKVVRAKQAGLSPTEHKNLMHGGNRFLLLKRRFDLTEKEKDQLKKWFRMVPEFKLAYDTKEAGYDIWKYSSSRNDAKRRFKKWRDNIPEEVEPAFKGFVNMITRWERYIFNYFEYRVTNAFTESKNRDIKSFQRHGRRTSFVVLRARLIFLPLTRKVSHTKEEINACHIRGAMKKAEEKE
jgi:transposase